MQDVLAGVSVAQAIRHMRVEETPQALILFITTQSLLPETTRVSLKSVVYFVSVSSYNVRNVRGQGYSAVFLQGISARELERSFPDLFLAVRNACVSNMTTMLEI